jgi:hypothetical protein
MQNQGPPCLLYYTLGSPVRSLGFSISSKFQEKFHSFSEGDYNFLENSAPPTWATALTSMASYQEVSQDEYFPYKKNSKISKGIQICTLSEKMKVERFFHKRCCKFCSQNANQIYNQGNIDEQHWAHKPPLLLQMCNPQQKIAVSTCKNLAFHILKENTIDMKDVKAKSFSNPGVVICNISNWNLLSVTRRWENKDKVRFFSNLRVAVHKVSN